MTSSGKLLSIKVVNPFETNKFFFFIISILGQSQEEKQAAGHKNCGLSTFYPQFVCDPNVLRGLSELVYAYKTPYPNLAGFRDFDMIVCHFIA
jgi:hypothetical protein